MKLSFSDFIVMKLGNIIKEELRAASVRGVIRPVIILYDLGCDGGQLVRDALLEVPSIRDGIGETYRQHPTGVHWVLFPGDKARRLLCNVATDGESEILNQFLSRQLEANEYVVATVLPDLRDPSGEDSSIVSRIVTVEP